MKTNEDIINYISEKLNVSEKWMFLSKEIDGDKMHICLLSPSEEEALMCIMHWLRDNPKRWESLKSTIEKYKK